MAWCGAKFGAASKRSNDTGCSMSGECFGPSRSLSLIAVVDEITFFGESLVSTGSFAHKQSERSKIGKRKSRRAAGGPIAPHHHAGAQRKLFVVPRRYAEELSPWSQSAAKRLFDCSCVIIMFPLLLPVLLIVAVAVRLTSAGPVLFLQKRMGAGGRRFTILKFRTIMHDSEAHCHAVTTADNQPFTPIGPFLRRWKLDELPQVINILLGHMSLVGPRPKMLEHVTVDLCCRPGITGAATIAFACEEVILDCIPRHDLNSYYHRVILPAKQYLDAEYMASATFLSDLKLIVKSVLRKWDGSLASALLECERFEAESFGGAVDAQVEVTIPMEDTSAETISFRTGTV